MRVELVNREYRNRLDRTFIEAKVQKATRAALEYLGQELVKEAKLQAKKTISSRRPYNRPYGTGQHFTYFEAFRFEIRAAGRGANLVFMNDAPDAQIQEYGRRAGAKGINIGTSSTRRDALLSWVIERGLMESFRNRTVRRSAATGRFIKPGRLSEKQILYLVNRGIRRGRPAHHTMQRTVDALVLRGAENSPFSRRFRKLMAQP